MRLAPALLVLAALAAPAHATPAAPSGAGRTFTANAVTIWYEVRGAAGGTPLVVVNGGPGFDHTYELCSDVWDRLARSRPVVMWDQRGVGRSSALKSGQSCTLKDQIADLDALRRALGVERMDLLGHSWGGYFVMAYTLAHPDHVQRLIICDSASPKWTDTDFIFKYVFPEITESQAALDAKEAVGDPSANPESLHEYLGELFVSPERRAEFLAREKDYRYVRAVNEALNADLGKLDLWPGLPSITCPTLVLTGRFDANVAPSTAWKIHKAIPGSRWAAFEQSGHLPFFEEPDAFMKVVEPFLEGR